MEGKLVISTDKALLDRTMIFNFLSTSYWAQNRTKKEVDKAIEYSLCYGIYLNKKQIGFARIVTDYTIFAYLMDVLYFQRIPRK